MGFPERILDIRHKMRLSQDKFGEMLNISQRSVAAWESGARAPSFTKLSEIADILGVSVDFLLGRVDSPSAYFDTKKDPSPSDRERAVATAAAALQGQSAELFTQEEIQWLEEFVNTAIDRALEKRGLPSGDPAK